MEHIRKNWSIIKWVLGALLAAITWYFSVNFRLEETNGKIDRIEVKVDENSSNILHLETRVDSKHDLLLELKFNLRKYMEANGESYLELRDFKESK